MPRRRLRLSSYSDSDEEDDAIYHSATVTPPLVTTSPPNVSNSNSNSNPNTVNPVPISDDDEDYAEFLTPSPPPPPPPPSTTETETGSPIVDALSRLGLRLRSEWLNSCVQGLESSVPGFSFLDFSAKAKLCFQQFLFADMNNCGAGVLPENVDSMHLVDLKGPFVLQVDEIVNISCPLRGRYQEAPAGIKRCLKLSMTDGVQRVFGMEYRPIKDLKVLAPAGLKIVICNVHIRRGLLMLVPEALEVLGGKVQELESARQRLVDEVNKPPRGRRTRTGVVPFLATRATLAAWPSNNGSMNGSAPEYVTPVQPNEQGCAALVGSGFDTAQRTTEQRDIPINAFQSGSNTIRRTMEQRDTPINAFGSGSSTIRRTMEQRDIPINAFQSGSNTIRRTMEQCDSPINVFGSGSSTVQRTSEQHDTPINVLGSGTGAMQGTMEQSESPINVLGSGSSTVQRTTQQHNIPINEENPVASPSVNVVMDFDEMHIDTAPDIRENDASSPFADAIPEAEDINMVNEVEHPLIMSRDREIPFTYLASLSAKWAALRGKAPSIQGKIKCFLTGVKRFQYKQRETYELLAYVDDGSLISEILIDHHVVQKGIGHSPMEATAALTSSDKKKASDMKEIFKQFQIFLVNFEGTMVVEMKETSSYPIAIEMTQGCPPSDPVLLLRRLESSSTSHVQALPCQNPNIDPIVISP